MNDDGRKLLLHPNTIAIGLMVLSFVVSSTGSGPAVAVGILTLFFTLGWTVRGWYDRKEPHD